MENRLTHPKLLFLDEPPSGLDSAASYCVMSQIARLSKRFDSEISGDFSLVLLARQMRRFHRIHTSFLPESYVIDCYNFD